MLENAIRALRKWRSSGAHSTLNEGVNLLAESQQARYLVSKLVLSKVNYLDYTDLLKITEPSINRWEVFTNTTETEGISIPKKVRIAPTKQFSKLPTVSPSTSWVFELRDATVAHPFGLTICDGTIVKETIASHNQGLSRIEKAVARSIKHHGYRNIADVIQADITSRASTYNAAVPLLLLWNNYYHWTIECLPRLAAVNRYQNATGVKPTVLVSEESPSWMLESLELAGVSSDQYASLTTHTAVDRLVLPSYPRPTRAECEWVKNTVRESVSPSNNEESRIYVTRRNATRRRVHNEPRLLDFLHEYGFKSYALEDLSVAQQVNLFSDADVIVAPHGAGLANIVYSDSITVIELFGESKKTTFYRLAKLLNHEYHYLLNRERYADIVVDISQVERLLDDIITCSKSSSSE